MPRRVRPNPSLERDLHRHGTWPASRLGPSSGQRAKRHTGVGPSAQTLGRTDATPSRPSRPSIRKHFALVGACLCTCGWRGGSTNRGWSGRLHRRNHCWRHPSRLAEKRSLRRVCPAPVANRLSHTQRAWLPVKPGCRFRRLVGAGLRILLGAGWSTGSCWLCLYFLGEASCSVLSQAWQAPAGVEQLAPRSECGLTLRSSGPPPAWHLACEALAVIIRFAGQAPSRFRPAQLKR